MPKTFDLSGSGMKAPSIGQTPLFGDSDNNGKKPNQTPSKKADSEGNNTKTENKGKNQKTDVKPEKTTAAKENKPENKTPAKKATVSTDAEVGKKSTNRSVVIPSDLNEKINEIVLKCGVHKNFNAYVVSLLQADYDANGKKYETLLMVQNMDPEELAKKLMGMNE